jgi:adenylate cyclase
MKIRRKKTSTPFWSPWIPEDWPLFIIAPGVALLVSVASSLGLLQSLELTTLDFFFRVRPLEPADNRVSVITIDEEDIRKIGTWPIPDQYLAQVLSNLKTQKPRVIGLDVYRDFPVEPGYPELLKVFKSTPNLIGVRQMLGREVIPPSSVLAKLNQVADAQLLEDPDQRVRRSLLTAAQNGQVVMGIGLATTLKYLEVEKIKPKPVEGQDNLYQLGNVQIGPLKSDDGGYVQADALGFQTLLNFRGGKASFQTISFTDALNNRIPEEWVKDRVVMIGTTAESIKDTFLTPYGNGRGHSSWMPGVFIHANITSQLLSSALDNRPLLRGIPGSWRWIWILGGAIAGVLVCWNLLQTTELMKRLTSTLAIVGVGIASAGGLVIGYVLFLQGWWIPVVTGIVALDAAAIACFIYHSYKLQRLAYFDGLTQIPNRRYFDVYLAQQVQKRGSLVLMLCDVDFFKLYNNTYGHPAGDICLQKVAQAAQRAVQDLGIVARYGGEEFVIVLPNAYIDQAVLVAERLVEEVKQLRISHETSSVADYITLSCGVTTVEIDEQKLNSPDWSGANLITVADAALYSSKQKGRDRYTLVEYEAS